MCAGLRRHPQRKDEAGSARARAYTAGNRSRRCGACAYACSMVIDYSGIIIDRAHAYAANRSRRCGACAYTCGIVIHCSGIIIDVANNAPGV